MILLIDNYDSFVHNLARYVAELGCQARVVRNDQITIAAISALAPSAIIISPGPCTPQQAGISLDVVRQFGPTIPILGVCLGHQVVAEAYGAQVIRAERPIHGQTSPVLHQTTGLFAGLPTPMRATRYHSLIVDEDSLPAELHVTARTADGIIMALEHRTLPVFGTQFHPEAVMTEAGHQLLENFLQIANIKVCQSAATIPPELAVSSRIDEICNAPSQPLHW